MKLFVLAASVLLAIAPSLHAADAVILSEFMAANTRTLES